MEGREKKEKKKEEEISESFLTFKFYRWLPDNNGLLDDKLILQKG